MTVDSNTLWVVQDGRRRGETQCPITLPGELAVEQNGRKITHFRTQKTAALLAFLVPALLVQAPAVGPH